MHKNPSYGNSWGCARARACVCACVYIRLLVGTCLDTLTTHGEKRRLLPVVFPSLLHQFLRTLQKQ